MSTLEPVRKQVVVAASRETAFRVFTEAMQRWWPRDHYIGKSPVNRMTLEPRAGGRWYETGEDGTECNWGRVLIWDPPGRLVLAWQLTAEWQFDADFVTEVEVTFTAEGPNETLVVVEHRNLDRFGTTAGEKRKSFDAPGGWTQTLESFARIAEGRS
jgi:uncharacterized protein YndB with AHSA1/START domain